MTVFIHVGKLSDMGFFFFHQVHVFQAEFSGDRQAFFSLSNDLNRRSQNENVGQLNGLYADKLGIPEGEEVGFIMVDIIRKKEDKQAKLSQQRERERERERE